MEFSKRPWEKNSSLRNWRKRPYHSLNFAANRLRRPSSSYSSTFDHVDADRLRLRRYNHMPEHRTPGLLSKNKQCTPDSSTNHAELEENVLTFRCLQENPSTSTFNNSSLVEDAIVYDESCFVADVHCLQDACLYQKFCKDDADYYYRKIQTLSNGYMAQLLAEKKKLHEEFRQAKKRLKEKCDFIEMKLETVEKVFEEVTVKEVLDNFSNLQKQGILSEESGIKAMKSDILDTLLESAGNTEDRFLSESVFGNQRDRIQIGLNEQAGDVELLLAELKEVRNEVEVVRSDGKDMVNSIGQSYQAAQREHEEIQEQLSEIRTVLQEKTGLNCQIVWDQENSRNILRDIRKLIKDGVTSRKSELQEDGSCLEYDSDSSVLKVTEIEVHLVTIIASFLKVIPFAASIDFIHSYLVKIDNVLKRRYIERLMRKFPTFFKEEGSIGNSESKWSYLDLKPIITL